MGNLAFEIVLIDPCISTAVVIANAQTSPDPYFYESSLVPSLNWSVIPYGVDYNCVITYSCQTLSGPVAALDICSNTGANGEATFDGAAGTYVLKTNDMVAYPPGDYVLSITGTVGTSSDSSPITVTLVDPCDTLTLNLPNPDPFND